MNPKLKAKLWPAIKLYTSKKVRQAFLDGYSRGYYEASEGRKHRFDG